MGDLFRYITVPSAAEVMGPDDTGLAERLDKLLTDRCAVCIVEQWSLKVRSDSSIIALRIFRSVEPRGMSAAELPRGGSVDSHDQYSTLRLASRSVILDRIENPLMNLVSADGWKDSTSTRIARGDDPVPTARVFWPEIRDVPLGTAIEVFDERSVSRRRQVSLLGMSLDDSVIVIIGPLFIALLLLVSHRVDRTTFSPSGDRYSGRINHCRGSPSSMARSACECRFVLCRAALECRPLGVPSFYPDCRTVIMVPGPYNRVSRFGSFRDFANHGAPPRPGCVCEITQCVIRRQRRRTPGALSDQAYRSPQRKGNSKRQAIPPAASFVSPDQIRRSPLATSSLSAEARPANPNAKYLA